MNTAQDSPDYDDTDIIYQPREGLAIYPNQSQNIVLREFGSPTGDDSFVVIDKEKIDAVIAKLQELKRCISNETIYGNN